VSDGIELAVGSHSDELVETRRRIHQDPELGFDEHRTAQLIADRCTELGYSVTTEVGKTGVVADLDSGKPGPTVMLRADMDALPISERHDFAWKSQNQGVMHACGHDGHVSIQLVVASIMKERDDWRGKLRLCFQPAEESAGGAQPMIAAGVLDEVSQAFGLHLFTTLPVGHVGVTEGTIFASADGFIVRVVGQGGHGGMPHLGIDPISVAVQIVNSLNLIVSRETSPFAPAVVTVGQFHAGTAHNIIPEEAVFSGTVRAFTPEERVRMLQRVEEIARTVAKAHRAEVDFSLANQTPAVVCAKEPTQLVRSAAEQTVGAGNLEIGSTTTGADDMAYFLEKVPGCYFLVGAGYTNRKNAPHHHPEFDIDEASLAIGAQTMARAALLALR
jgi:amidohydrolase